MRQNSYSLDFFFSPLLPLPLLSFLPLRIFSKRKSNSVLLSLQGTMNVLS